MNPELIKENIKNVETWRRGIPMLVLFISFYSLVQPMLIAIMLVQFIAQLFFQKRLDNLYAFSSDLANYSRNIWMFLSYNSDQKIFPFADWSSSCHIGEEPSQI
ncbi:MAG: DUF4389 domain-containing protein [Proteobacteria bacterium]|nr:DUF4389 domain-containing protein [Pseudomonadota bacterium]